MRAALGLAALAAAAVASQANAADAGAGKAVFRKCAACHFATEPKNKVGPHLVGVVGRPAAAVEGFRYSASMKELAAGGLIWDEATLARYLRKPKDVVPGGSMAFAGLPDAGDIADVIAYLAADPKP